MKILLKITEILLYSLHNEDLKHTLRPLNTTYMAYFRDSNSRGRGFGGGGGGFGGRSGGSRGGFGGSRGGFGGGRGGDRGPAEMHPATCSNCNADCEVPFKPNGKKPVLCHSCFKGSAEQGDRPRFERNDRGDRGSSRDFTPKSFGERGDRDGARDSKRKSGYDAVCSDCGSECEVPFKPNGKKDVYCNDCYGAHSPNGHDESTGGKARRSDDRSFDSPRANKSEGECCGSGKCGSGENDRLDKLNAKLDRLTLILTSFIATVTQEDNEETETLEVDEVVAEKEGEDVEE